MNEQSASQSYAERMIAERVARGEHNEIRLPTSIERVSHDSDALWAAVDRELCRACGYGHISTRPAKQHELA